MCDVVITGIGVVSPLGNSRRAFTDRLYAGRSGVGPVTRFDARSFKCRLAAEADDEGLATAVRGPFSHEIARMDRFAQYALIAARDACGESGIAANGGLPPDGAVFMGVGLGGLPHIEAGVLRQEALGPNKTMPYLIPSLIPNMAASMVSLDVGFEGPQYTFSGACSSGNQALGEAFLAISGGRYRWSLAGGTEAVITPITFSGFQAMRALSCRNDRDATPRPFDRQRDGMIVGEGAAIFVIEEATHAVSRRAMPIGRLVGYATRGGGEGIATRSSSAAVSCMAGALKQGGLEATKINVIFAHAPGMQHDERELAAIRTTFHEAGARPAVTSPEGHIGHTFGASGPLGLAAALGAIHRQEIPPTLNLDEPATGYEDMDLVARPRSTRIEHCLINSFGFGGVHASLICAKA